jgi:hypothetical protein
MTVSCQEDALGHAAATAHRRATGHQRPQHVIAAQARRARAARPIEKAARRRLLAGPILLVTVW